MSKVEIFLLKFKKDGQPWPEYQLSERNTPVTILGEQANQTFKPDGFVCLTIPEKMDHAVYAFCQSSFSDFKRYDLISAFIDAGIKSGDTKARKSKKIPVFQYPSTETEYIILVQPKAAKWQAVEVDIKPNELEKKTWLVYLDQHQYKYWNQIKEENFEGYSCSSLLAILSRSAHLQGIEEVLVNCSSI